MDKATIADVLEKIATLLELKGENPFKIRAYVNAARSLETWGGNIADLSNEEVLEKIPGIGKAIAAKIKELVETGALKFFDDLRAEFPADILELFVAAGLGAKRSRRSREASGQFHCAIARSLRNQTGRATGIGKTTQEKLFRAIDDGRSIRGRFSLDESPRKRSCCRTISRPSRGSTFASPAVTDAARKCAGPRFHRRDEGAGGNQCAVCAASTGRIGDRPGADEIERPGSLRHSMRPASGSTAEYRSRSIILPGVRSTILRFESGPETRVDFE